MWVDPSEGVENGLKRKVDSGEQQHFKTKKQFDKSGMREGDTKETKKACRRDKDG